METPLSFPCRHPFHNPLSICGRGLERKRQGMGVYVYERVGYSNSTRECHNLTRPRLSATLYLIVKDIVYYAPVCPIHFRPIE